MNWDSTLIHKIRRNRKDERQKAPEMAKREDSLLKLMSRSLYGEKVHYALELIQNAQDAGSTSITFIFEPEGIIAVNDGEVFTADDVDAICSVKPGRKKNKIGFFGVGFKSVFNVTSRPQIISSDFNFSVEGYIYPTPSDDIPNCAKDHYSRDRGSIFVLPQSDGLPTISDLIDNFREIDDKILLFLNSLRSLHFVDLINDEKWSIEKAISENNIIQLVDGREEDAETSWLVFHRDLPVNQDEVQIPEGKEGITETRIIIAFPCDDATQENNKGSTVYCYLPTKKRSDMPFLVQADFVPTVGRGDIQEIEWNNWLLSCIGTLAADAVEALNSDSDFGPKIFDFVPLKDEVQEPMMDGLCDAIYESLEKKRIARTSSGKLKLAQECVIPESQKVSKILSEKDLELFFEKQLHYIDSAYSDRAKAILEEIGSILFEGDDFVKFICNASFIKNREPYWYLKAYDYLSDIFDVTDKDYNGDFNWDYDTLDLFSELKRSRFLLPNENELVALENPDFKDRLVCYPHSINLAEINSIFTEGEIVFLHKHLQLSNVFKRKKIDPEEEHRRKRVHEFLAAIGVKKYFKQSHVIKNVIIPKYESGKDKRYDNQKLFKLVNYIRNYWSTLESEVNNKKISKDIFSKIRKAIRLKAYKIRDGEKIEAYLSPSEMYFPKRYGKNQAMEDLFKRVPNVYFLHAFYLNKEKSLQKKKKRGRKRAEYGWKKFAEMLGVWSSPIVEMNNDWVSILHRPEHNWIEKEESPSGMHEIKDDSWSKDIESLIQYCETLDDGGEVRERMKLLWKSLSDNWASIYSNHCNSKYRWKYYSEQTKDLYTSRFLNYLKESEWVPGEDSGFHRPSVVFLGTRKNKLLLGKNKVYTSLAGNQVFLSNIGVNIEPKINSVADHVIEFKQENPNTKKSEIRKFEAIYSYIHEKIEDTVIKDALVIKFRELFDKNELIYLPRSDKSWWKPSNVFWNDNSKIFEDQRGYIENRGNFFYSDNVKEFFQNIGIKENPNINQVLVLMDELEEKNDVETLKRLLTKSYAYINDSLQKTDGDIEWDKFRFLTEKDNFMPADELFFDDDESFTKVFSDNVEFVLLPHLSWLTIHGFLKAAGFRSFQHNLEIIKNFKQVNEMEGGETSYIIKALNYSKEFLLQKNIHEYTTLEESGVFDKIPELSIYETDSIRLNLKLNKKSGVELRNNIEKEAYFSTDENRLYVQRGTSLFTGIVAREISRLFKTSASEVFLFLSSIINLINDDEKLEAQLGLFGMKGDTSDYSVKDGIKFIPDEDEKDEPSPEPELETDKRKEKLKVSPPKPKPKPKRRFIDPNFFIPTKFKPLEPYKKIDGQVQQNAPSVRLRKGVPGIRPPASGPRPIIERGDAEGIALQIVANYEYCQGRIAEDRHSQRGIGYDIYSKNDHGNERFIEVKHFSEKESRFQLKPHQLKMAEEKGSKYFVYIVKGLIGGSKPRLFIIQNPVQWLTPDPPTTKDYSEWKNGVLEEVEFSSIEAEE